MLQPPSSPKICILTCFLKKNIDVEQKAKHRIRKKTKIRKGDWNEKRREETNKNEKGLMNKNFGIEYFDVALFMKQKQRRKQKERKRQKQGTKRKQKRKTRRKEERREKERGREKESGKGGGQKRPGRKKGKHSKMYKKVPFLGGNTGFSIKDKERKGEQKSKKPNKKNNQKKTIRRV